MALGRQTGQAIPDAQQVECNGRMLVVVDPHLFEVRGHELPYARAICGEAQRSGDGCLVVVPEGVSQDVLDRVTAIATIPWCLPLDRAIRGRVFRKVHFTWLLVERNIQLLRGLSAAQSHLNAFSGKRVIFFPNCYLTVLFGALAWAVLRASRSDTLVFLHRMECSRGHSLLYRLAYRLARVCSLPVVAVTDSDRLASFYGPITKEVVRVLPIPHTRRDGGGSEAAVRERWGRWPRYVYLGSGHRSQGFQLLADAICHLAERDPETLPEVYVQAKSSTPEAKEAVSRMRSAGYPRLTIEEGVLSEERYCSVLRSADVVLLPYDASVYRYRTSGVMAEALALGKVVVVPADTWMADQLQSGSGVTFTGNSAASLADSIKESGEMLEALTERGLLLRNAWVQFHSPASFYELLTAAADSASAPDPS